VGAVACGHPKPATSGVVPYRSGPVSRRSERTETRVPYTVHGDGSLHPLTTKRTILHQMRPFPPMWRRPMDDRPPYAVWVIASLVVWGIHPVRLHGMGPAQHIPYHIWAIFGGRCIGVLGASIARKIYR
jgi:hypothetical protein